MRVLRERTAGGLKPPGADHPFDNRQQQPLARVMLVVVTDDPVLPVQLEQLALAAHLPQGLTDDTVSEQFSKKVEIENVAQQEAQGRWCCVDQGMQRGVGRRDLLDLRFGQRANEDVAHPWERRVGMISDGWRAREKLRPLEAVAQIVLANRRDHAPAILGGTQYFVDHRPQYVPGVPIAGGIEGINDEQRVVCPRPMGKNIGKVVGNAERCAQRRLRVGPQNVHRQEDEILASLLTIKPQGVSKAAFAGTGVAHDEERAVVGRGANGWPDVAREARIGA